MSTQAHCLIVEITPNQWFYLLQDPSAPTEDWRSSAFAHGPFSTDDFAQEHLRQNYPQPAMQPILPLAKGQERYDLEQDAVLAKRLEPILKRRR